MTNVSNNSSLCIHESVHICLFVSLCLSMSFDGGVREMGQERLDGLTTIRRMRSQQEESHASFAEVK